MKDFVNLDREKIEIVVGGLIDAMKKEIRETPDIENYEKQIKQSVYQDNAIIKAEYDFTYGTVQVHGTKEVTLSHCYQQKRATDRFYWELSLPDSRTRWIIKGKSPEGVRDKLLLKNPRKGTVAVFASLFADYLNQNYYGVFISNKEHESIYSQSSLEFLGKKYEEACERIFSDNNVTFPAEDGNGPCVKIMVLNSKDEDVIQTRKDFEDCFFTTTDDSRFSDNEKGKEDRFKKLISIWKVQIKGNRQADIQAAANRFATVVERNTIRDAIIRKARRLPIVNGLLIGERYRQVHALLRELCVIVIPSAKKAPVEIIVAKPMETISHLVLDPISKILPQREYTAYDYILTLGKYAERAGSRDNHMFYESEIESSVDAIIIHDAASPDNRLLVCNKQKKETTYRFRLKQFRLFVDAMSCALTDNEKWRTCPNYARTNNALQRLLSTKGMEQETTENEKTRHAGRHFSAETFYAECYIEFVDAIHRRTLIEALEDVAGNFSVQPDRSRNHQEIAISILSYLLYERSTELSSTFREKMFEAAYGRSLYKPQGEVWAELRNTSLFYVKHAKEVFEKSCKLEKQRALDGSIMNFAAGQPLFNFLLADLYTREERESKSESFQRMLQGCDIQKKTWFLSENIEDLPPDFSKNAISLICLLGERLEKDPESPHCMEVIYGLNMAFYGLANLKYMDATTHVHNVEQLLKDKETADKVRRAVLLCDYWNRRRNYIYSCKLGRYYLITGTIRFVCSYNFRASIVDEYLPVGVSFTKNYTTWLEWQKERNKRYFFLMLRLLSYSAFDIRSFFDRSAYDGLSFLPYDNMPFDADAYFAAPYELYQESEEKDPD